MGLLGIVLTLFFGLLSLYLFLRSRHRKRLTFTYDLDELQTRTHPEVTILFNGQPIENLFRLRVVVWNSGNQEIRQSDIPPDAAPSIKLNRGRILSIATLDASAGIQFSTTRQADTGLTVYFNFLNANDFATIDVLYESTGPKPVSVEFVGRVIGGLASESRHFEQQLKPFNWIAPIVAITAWCLGAYDWATHIRNWVHRIPGGYSIGWVAAGFTLGLLVGLLCCYAIIYEYRRVYYRSRLPRLAQHAFTRVPTAPTTS